MTSKTGGIRVMLVDDQRMVREGLRSMLETVPNIEVVGEASDGEEAIACIGTTNPQVVVMDMHMPKMDGLAATRLLATNYPFVAVVGFSITDDRYHQAAMERAGAFRVMTKGKHGIDELCQEIEKAAAAMRFLAHQKVRLQHPADLRRWSS